MDPTRVEPEVEIVIAKARRKSQGKSWLISVTRQNYAALKFGASSIT